MRNGFVFPYPDIGGYTNLGSLEALHDTGHADVGVRRGGQQWAGEWPYGHGSGRDRCALDSSFDSQTVKMFVVVVRRQGSAQHPAVPLDLFHLAAISLRLHLPWRPFPRSSNDPAPERDGLAPSSVSLLTDLSSTSGFVCERANLCTAMITRAFDVPSSTPSIP